MSWLIFALGIFWGVTAATFLGGFWIALRDVRGGR